MAEKQKMSQRKFMLIWIPLIVILLGVIIAATAVANAFAPHLDTYIGTGDRVVVVPEGTENWDTGYYKQNYSKTDGDNGSQAGSAAVAQSIADEGTVLMKNDGVLPLAAQSKVAPYGFRYKSPFYGGTGSGNMDTSHAYVVSPQTALSKNFTTVDVFNTVNESTPVTKYIYDNIGEQGVLAFYDGVQGFNGSDQGIYEFGSSIYNTGAVAAADKTATAAIVFIGRAGGENNDLWTVPYTKRTTVTYANASAGSQNPSKLTSEAIGEGVVKHALVLMPEEREMIAKAKAMCGKTVVVLNTSNALELGELADDSGINAILWVGGPGAKGFQSMSDIMANKVNPSGRLPDVFVRDLTADPTWKNLGDLDGYIYSNTDGMGPVSGKHYGAPRSGNNGTNPIPYLEYEEGVYLGYKYYETAYDENLSGFTYGELNADGSVKTAGQVIYPFGYGLSYSKFSQEIVSFTGNKDKVSVEVKVTNTDGAAGKETVQIYFTAPYTQYDRDNNIEKPTALLAGFAKTKLLEKGASDTVKVEFVTDVMASYTSKRNNGDGTYGCYMLDAGEYKISLRSNSHDVIEAKTFNISGNIFFDSGNPRQSEVDAQSMLGADGSALSIPAKAEKDPNSQYIAASNQFDDCNKYVSEGHMEGLTRASADGLGSGSITAAAKYGKAAPGWVVDKLAMFSPSGNLSDKRYNPAVDPELGNVEASKVYHKDAPAENAEKTATLSSLRGLSYYDDMWDELLDQLDYSDSQVKTTLFQTIYCVNAIDSIGLSRAQSLDGPQGLTLAGRVDGAYSTCAFPSAPVIAATFNTSLAYDFGYAVGQEAVTIAPIITGWYAPGLNTHRTAFSGRNFEYYSEDGVLAGKICARVVSGAGDMGVASHIKHFALNDVESNRANVSVWATEQTIREIYLKPFEITVKEARSTLKYISDENGTVSTKVIRGATALMTSYNSIGPTYTAGHYGLLTGCLRNEWGFQGGVISDMTSGVTQRLDQMIRAGNDYALVSRAAGNNATDTESATAKWAMRNSVHHIAYMVANSNAMQGVAPGAIAYYTMSPWAVWLLIANIAVYLVVLGGATWVILRHFKVRKNPNAYRSA